LNRKLNQQL
jgi:hypothetical protein